MFSEYFRAQKLEDMQTRMARHMMKGIGLSDKPYQQNIPESSNDMLKDWCNFVPQDMDKFMVSVYDFAESFYQEEELAWFQLSDKWEVCAQFQHHLSSKIHGEKAFMQNVDEVCYSFSSELLHVQPLQVRAHQISFLATSVSLPHLMACSLRRKRQVCLKKRKASCTMRNFVRVSIECNALKVANVLAVATSSTETNRAFIA